MRWQPIETAPKDGTAIKLRCDAPEPGYHWGGGDFWWQNGSWHCHLGQMITKYPPTHWAPLRAKWRAEEPEKIA